MRVRDTSETERPELSTYEMHRGGRGKTKVTNPQLKEPFSSQLSDDKKLGKWFVNYFQQENVAFEVIAIQLEIPRRQRNMQA